MIIPSDAGHKTLLFTDDKSTLVTVMACCLTAPELMLTKIALRLCGIRLQWVNSPKVSHGECNCWNLKKWMKPHLITHHIGWPWFIFSMILYDKMVLSKSRRIWKTFRGYRVKWYSDYHKKVLVWSLMIWEVKKYLNPTKTQLIDSLLIGNLMDMTVLHFWCSNLTITSRTGKLYWGC